LPLPGASRVALGRGLDALLPDGAAGSPSASTTDGDGDGDGNDALVRIPDAHRREYSEAVWQAFQEHSGVKRPLMGSAEGSLVRQWMDAGFPLRVVLTGIRECRGTDGRTLLYYAGPVRERVEQWHRSFTL
jgi:hypothetical protein